MLARTFLTHEELGLQKHEYDALVTTLYMIEDEQIGPELIYMDTFTRQMPCGTAHCLAGWANTVDNRAFPETVNNGYGGGVSKLYDRLPRELSKLFWLNNVRGYPSDEAPAKLRTYLETGRCD